MHFLFDVVHEICDSFPCLNGGECKNEENGYTCMCKGHINGTNCESKFCVGDVSYAIFSNDRIIANVLSLKNPVDYTNIK